MARYSDRVQNQAGAPLAGATVYVYEPDGDLAELTADGGGELANPVTTDSAGNFYFNADDGLYRLEIHYGGRLYLTDEAVVVSDGAIPGNDTAASISAAISAGLALDARLAAEAAVDDAEAARDEAELYAQAAAVPPQRIYDTTADGLAAVANGEFFYVEDSSGNLPLYKDNAGAAQAQAFIMPGAALLTTASKTHERFTSPFLQAVSDTYMRNVVEDIYVEGGMPGHVYVLNRETLNLGGGNGRVTFRLHNATLGIDVAQWQKLDTQANINARTSPYIFGYQGSLVGYRGVTFSARINWTAITDWAQALTTYTTAAQGGIRPDRVSGWHRIGVFKELAEPKIRLTVGAGSVTATHFNSFAAAIASLYIPGVTITRSTYPCSDICSFANQVLIECIDDGYSESIAATTIGGIDQSTVLLPPFITLRGRGDTRLHMSAGPLTAPVIEAPFPFRIERMVIESQGPGYAVHIDNNNFLAKRATVGPPILAYRMMSVFYECTIIGSVSQLTWTIGCGISNGHTIRLERCRIIGAAGLPMLGVHTSASTTDAGEIEVIDCYFNDALITSATAMQLTKINAMSVQHKVIIENTDMASFSVGNTIDVTPGYQRRGKVDPAISITPNQAALAT